MQICKFYSNKFSIKKCIYGLGVFSNENIKAGTLLEEIIPWKMSRILFILYLFINKIYSLLKIENRTNLFKFLGYDNQQKIFHILPTMFMYSNNSKDQDNIKFVYDNRLDIYRLIVIKDILIGEQLLLKYSVQKIYYK
jgi:SET domain-containing protein